MSTPFGLGKRIILEYSEVAFLGLVCVNVSGGLLVGSMSKNVLWNWPNMAKGVNCQRRQDHVSVTEVADNYVTNGSDTCCWVGYVVASEPLLLIFL